MKQMVWHGKLFFTYAIQNDTPAGRFKQAHIDQHYTRHCLVARAHRLKQHAEAPCDEGIGKKELPMTISKEGIKDISMSIHRAISKS
jgi:hypothetical protein